MADRLGVANAGQTGWMCHRGRWCSCSHAALLDTYRATFGRRDTRSLRYRHKIPWSKHAGHLRSHGDGCCRLSNFSPALRCPTAEINRTRPETLSRLKGNVFPCLFKLFAPHAASATLVPRKMWQNDAHPCTISPCGTAADNHGRTAAASRFTTDQCAKPRSTSAATRHLRISDQPKRTIATYKMLPRAALAHGSTMNRTKRISPKAAFLPRLYAACMSSFSGAVSTDLQLGMCCLRCAVRPPGVLIACW